MNEYEQGLRDAIEAVQGVIDGYEKLYRDMRDTDPKSAEFYEQKGEAAGLCKLKILKLVNNRPSKSDD